MSPETDSINHSLSPVQQIRSILGDFAEFLQTRMDVYSNTSSFRIAVYFIEGILIGLFTYLWLEYAQMGALYHWLFPIIVSSSIVIAHYTITEILYKFWKPDNKTVGMFWLFSFAGVVVSFVLVYSTGICGLVCQVTGSYCPLKWHTSPPDTIAVFFKTIILPWLISNSLLTQGIVKKEMAKELAGIKQINASLNQKKIEINTQNFSINDETEAGRDSFSVSLKDGIKRIDFIDIYFIAIEDHYCKIVFNSNGEICKEYVRLTLQEALDSLPSSDFARIHRSYAVNLKHVKHIKKEGQAYRLFIEGSANFLPASRHRAHSFLPKLKAILN